MNDAYKNNEGCNPNKKRKVLLAFDDMNGKMLRHKKRNAIVTEIRFT